MSLGAVMTEGDARLRIPSPLPDGVSLDVFAQWASKEARIIWISDYLETILEAPVDLTNVAGLVEVAGLTAPIAQDANDRVPLYVPSFDYDRVRTMPGVSWDRRRRTYVASKLASLEDIFPYLTPAMRAIWVADRNLDTAMVGLVRARAMREMRSQPSPEPVVPDDDSPEDDLRSAFD